MLSPKKTIASRELLVSLVSLGGCSKLKFGLHHSNTHAPFWCMDSSNRTLLQPNLQLSNSFVVVAGVPVNLGHLKKFRKNSLWTSLKAFVNHKPTNGRFKLTTGWLSGTHTNWLARLVCCVKPNSFLKPVRFSCRFYFMHVPFHIQLLCGWEIFVITL